MAAHETVKTPDAIIVGAGPVGMTAALAMAARGYRPIVIERDPADRVRPGSRAIFIHRASLQLLEQIQAGLGHRCREHGLTWQTKRTLYRGREIYRRTYPAPPKDKLPSATSLPQPMIEQMLMEACRSAGIEFVWNAPVVGVQTDVDGVQLALDGGRSMRARYVIAADGARSAVRQGARLRLEGPKTTNAFVIVDVAEDESDPLPRERVFHYEHPAVGGRNVLFVPFAGHWRVDLQCRPDDRPDDFSKESSVHDWLKNVMPAKYADRVTWVSTYIFRQAVADRFRDASGRILLIGEAAHVFAPFGARGLNSGIPDAYLAAAAVDRALKATDKNQAHAAVDRYATSRRTAALRNRDASSQALRHLTAPTWPDRLKRRLVAQAARYSLKSQKWLDAAPYGPPLGPPDADGMQY